MATILWNSVLDTYFDEQTMSLHLKADRPVLRKKWTPGNWQPVVDPNEIMTKENFNQLVDALFKEVETRDDAFLEINRELSKVMQVGPYRIVIVYAPLSDGMEMTVVKPVKKMSMEEYQLDPELFDLLRNKAKGILISGAPGSGKSTFAGALIDVYHKDNHIIKTIESPRDLIADEFFIFLLKNVLLIPLSRLIDREKAIFQMYPFSLSLIFQKNRNFTGTVNIPSGHKKRHDLHCSKLYLSS